MSPCLPGKTQTALEQHASSLAVTDDASWQDYTVLGVLYWHTWVVLGVILGVVLRGYIKGYLGIMEKKMETLGPLKGYSIRGYIRGCITGLY